MAAAWKPDSWRAKPVLQVPNYLDQAALQAVERDLQKFPPLVFIKEVSDLKAKLAGVAAGEASCCRAATAPRASRSTRPTTSATISSCSCRWR